MRTILNGRMLTSRESARLIGVSEATVKRWADAGLLPGVKTAGGHRRFRPEDVAQFRRASHGTTRTPPTPAAAAALVTDADAHADDEAVARAMYEALVAGRAEEASALAVSLHLHGRGVAAISDAALCPALRKVGDLWEQGALSVADEHAATWAARSALGALRAAVVPAPGAAAEVGAPRALCCSVEEDFHEFPVRIAALVLEAAGWDVITLGASTPFAALAEACDRWRPRLVCVAATALPHLDRATREYEGFRAAAGRAGAAVALGGAGFRGEGVRRRFPAELHAESFTDLDDFAAASPDGRGERGGPSG